MAEVAPIEPKVIDYCPYCTFPVEYCEFSNCWPKCSVNLKAKHPALFEKFKAAKDAKAAAQKAKSGADPAPAATAPETDDKAENTTKTSKAEGEDEDEDDSDGELTFTDITPAKTTTTEDVGETSAASTPAPAAKKQEITLQVTERTKRKRVTHVCGVENFGLVPKDLAKQFAKKFATSASAGDDGIVLNGDLLYDIADYILEQYPNIPQTALIKIEKGGIRKKVY